MDAVKVVLRDKDPELRKLWTEVCGKDDTITVKAKA